MCETWPPARLLHALITLQLAMRCPLCSRYLSRGPCRPLHRHWRVTRSERRECDPRDSLPAAATIQRPPSSGHRPYPTSMYVCPAWQEPQPSGTLHPQFFPGHGIASRCAESRRLPPTFPFRLARCIHVHPRLFSARHHSRPDPDPGPGPGRREADPDPVNHPLADAAGDRLPPVRPSPRLFSASFLFLQACIHTPYRNICIRTYTRTYAPRAQTEKTKAQNEGWKEARKQASQTKRNETPNIRSTRS